MAWRAAAASAVRELSEGDRGYVGNLNTFRNTALRPDFSNLETELIAGIDPERGFINADTNNFSFSPESRSILGSSSHFDTASKNSHFGC